MAAPLRRAPMAERRSQVVPVVVGILVPLLLILTNSVWGYAGILLTIGALVWLGFAIVLLIPSGTS